MKKKKSKRAKMSVKMGVKLTHVEEHCCKKVKNIVLVKIKTIHSVLLLLAKLDRVSQLPCDGEI